MDVPDEISSFTFDKKFREWMEESVGLSPEFLESLDEDDDWTFVIKIHGVLEAGLNHLLLSRLREPKLEKIVAHLETNDRRTGKIAFVEAYDLLPPDAILFVRVLSEVRNRAVHDIKNFDLNLVKYFDDLDKNQLGNWRKAITWWFSTPAEQAFLDAAFLIPRKVIYASCMQIIMRAFHQSTLPGRGAELFREFFLEHALLHPESTPKK